MYTTPFADKDSNYAFACVHDFFDHYGLSGALQELGRILKFAISNKAWKATNPCDVLCYMEKLDALCSAAFVMDASHSIIKGSILTAPDNGEPDMAIAQHYICRQLFHSTWSYFPRHLSASQYHNPYKAIRRFTRYITEAEWKKTSREITEYALRNSSLLEEHYPYNILTLQLRLLQLIEACHLLEVRSNISNPMPSPKPKKQAAKK